MALRAKTIAFNHVDGSLKEQFKRIYNYAHELIRSNFDSTTKVKVEESDGKPIFMRFYACFKPCKDNFMSS